MVRCMGGTMVELVGRTVPGVFRWVQRWCVFGKCLTTLGAIRLVEVGMSAATLLAVVMPATLLIVLVPVTL